MIITFDWLKDHLKTNQKEKNLLEQLTNIGLEVESVESLSADNELFKVAEIVKTEKHPNADRLKVCDVETINGIVTGYESKILENGSVECNLEITSKNQSLLLEAKGRGELFKGRALAGPQYIEAGTSLLG